ICSPIFVALPHRGRSSMRPVSSDRSQTNRAGAGPIGLALDEFFPCPVADASLITDAELIVFGRGVFVTLIDGHAGRDPQSFLRRLQGNSALPHERLGDLADTLPELFLGNGKRNQTELASLLGPDGFAGKCQVRRLAPT